MALKSTWRKVNELEAGKQDNLVSGTNIKTINGDSILGSGNLVVSGGGGISDGDKGDITVSGSGSVWTIDNNAVTSAKINDVDATKVTEDATHRFTTDTEKATWNAKQDALVSGTNIKTVNSTSLLGSGNVSVQETLVSATNIKTINGSSVLGSGNLTVSASPLSGTVVLINADEVNQNGGTAFTVKTYTLAANTYSRIIIESECELQTTANANATVNFAIYIGGVVKRIIENNYSATGSGDFVRSGIAIKYSEAITAGAVIDLRTESVTNCTFNVNSLRIYGVI